jgi:hypothetical protein
MSFKFWVDVDDVAAALAGFAAAAFWFWASRVPLPPDNADTLALLKTVRTQGKRNALGAICAAIAAVLTGISVLMGIG